MRPCVRNTGLVSFCRTQEVCSVTWGHNFVPRYCYMVYMHSALVKLAYLFSSLDNNQTVNYNRKIKVI